MFISANCSPGISLHGICSTLWVMAGCAIFIVLPRTALMSVSYVESYSYMEEAWEELVGIAM